MPPADDGGLAVTGHRAGHGHDLASRARPHELQVQTKEVEGLDEGCILRRPHLPEPPRARLLRDPGHHRHREQGQQLVLVLDALIEWGEQHQNDEPEDQPQEGRDDRVAHGLGELRSPGGVAGWTTWTPPV